MRAGGEMKGSSIASACGGSYASVCTFPVLLVSAVVHSLADTLIALASPL